MSHHTHGHDHGHAHHGGDATHHPSGRPNYFTEHEWADFQTSDRAAGGVVVALMTCIFALGLALYTTIALVV